MAIKSFPVHESSKIKTMDVQYWDNSQNVGMAKNRLKLQYKLYTGKQSTGKTYESFFNMDDNKNRNLKQKISRVLKDQDQADIDAFYDQVKQMFDQSKQAGVEVWFGFRVETFAKKDSKGRTVMLNGRAVRNSVTDPTCYCWAYPKRIGGHVVSIDVTILVTRVDDQNVESIDAFHVCVDKQTKKSPKCNSDLIGYWVKGEINEANDAAICAADADQEEQPGDDGASEAALAQDVEQPQPRTEDEICVDQDIPQVASLEGSQGMGTADEPARTTGHGEASSVGRAVASHMDDQGSPQARQVQRPAQQPDSSLPASIADRIRQLESQHMDSPAPQPQVDGRASEGKDSGRPGIPSQAGSDRTRPPLTEEQKEALEEQANERMKEEELAKYEAFKTANKKPMTLGTAKEWQS